MAAPWLENARSINLEREPLMVFPAPKGLRGEYVERQEGRNNKVGYVDHLAYFKVNRHTANTVGLFPGPTPLHN